MEMGAPKGVTHRQDLMLKGVLQTGVCCSPSSLNAKKSNQLPSGPEMVTLRGNEDFGDWRIWILGAALGLTLDPEAPGTDHSTVSAIGRELFYRCFTRIIAVPWMKRMRIFRPSRLNLIP